MKKKLLFSIIMIILIIPTTIFAFAGELIDNPKPEAPEEINEMASVILGAIQWAGYAIAIGMLMYVAIKYMMSAANEKAALKQSLINWAIGAFIVFAVTAIFDGIVGVFRDDIKINADTNNDNHEHNWVWADGLMDADGNVAERYQYCTTCGKRGKTLPKLPSKDNVPSDQGGEHTHSMKDQDGDGNLECEICGVPATDEVSENHGDEEGEAPEKPVDTPTETTTDIEAVYQ